MTKTQVAEFITESVGLIMNKHLSYKEYLKYCSKEKRIGETQATTYWKRVFEVIKEKYSLERDKEIDKHLYYLWELYSKALEKLDYNTARQILTDITKLKGLNEPDKIEIDQEITIKFNFGGPE